MKDPAALWYFNDWAGGTMAMTRHQKGAYLDLLTAQFNLGDLSLDQIKTVLGADFGPSWPALQKKFKHDVVAELYYNERLKQEMEKRKSYSASRRSNVSKRYVDDMKEHMEDRNENRNVLSIKNIYGEFQNVFLSEEDYQTLCGYCGTENNLKLLIVELSGYIRNQKKDPYLDHYATLQTWWRREAKKHVEKLPTKKIGSV